MNVNLNFSLLYLVTFNLPKEEKFADEPAAAAEPETAKPPKPVKKSGKPGGSGGVGLKITEKSNMSHLGKPPLEN